MSKQKIHIGKNGPAPCKATKRACRYGGEETHYDNMADANAAYEQQLAQEQEGSFSNATHKKEGNKSPTLLKDKPLEDQIAYYDRSIQVATEDYNDLKAGFEGGDSTLEDDMYEQGYELDELEIKRNELLNELNERKHEEAEFEAQQEEKGYFAGGAVYVDPKGFERAKQKEAARKQMEQIEEERRRKRETSPNRVSADTRGITQGAFSAADKWGDRGLDIKDRYGISYLHAMGKQDPAQREQALRETSVELVDDLKSLPASTSRGDTTPEREVENFVAEYNRDAKMYADLDDDAPAVIDDKLSERARGLSEAARMVGDRGLDSVSHGALAADLAMRGRTQEANEILNDVENDLRRTAEQGQWKDKATQRKFNDTLDAWRVSDGAKTAKRNERQASSEFLRNSPAVVANNANNTEKAADSIGYKQVSRGQFSGEGLTKVRSDSSGRLWNTNQKRYVKEAWRGGSKIRSNIDVIQRTDRDDPNAEQKFIVKRTDYAGTKKVNEYTVSGDIKDDNTVSNAFTQVYERKRTDDDPVVQREREQQRQSDAAYRQRLHEASGGRDTF